MHGTMHGIPPYADQKDKKSLKKSLPRKLESLWELVSSCSLQLIALQECPGRAMGFKKDDHVEELLRSVATALPNDPLHGWKILMFGFQHIDSSCITKFAAPVLIGYSAPFESYQRDATLPVAMLPVPNTVIKVYSFKHFLVHVVHLQREGVVYWYSIQ
jgi:hypothetical protein